MTRIAFLAAALVLAACRPAGDAAQSGESMAEGGATVDAPTGKSGDPVAEQVEGDADGAPLNEAEDGGSESEPEGPDLIPLALRGKWGVTERDCIPSRGDDKGKLVVTDNGLTFYESRARLTRILTTSPDRFAGEFAFTGEGQQWRRIERFRLVGDRLERRTDPQADQSEPLEALVYARCPRRT